MVQSKATTVAAYLKELPKDRAKIIRAVRKVMRANLAKGFKETMNWGMISYELPLKTYPDTYNNQPLMLGGLASQKNNCAVYLMCVYSDPKMRALLDAGFKKIGKKPDMGKSCIRFKSVDDIPLDVIGKILKKVTPKKLIASYESARTRNC